jgi:hypothetical protein
LDKDNHTNAPTAAFIRSMREVAVTLNSASSCLLSMSARLAEAGLAGDAQQLIGLARSIEMAEGKVRTHTKDAGIGMIVKLSRH